MNESDVGKIVFLKKHNIEGVLEVVMKPKLGSYAESKGYDHVLILKVTGSDDDNDYMVFTVNEGDVELKYIH